MSCGGALVRPDTPGKLDGDNVAIVTLDQEIDTQLATRLTFYSEQLGEPG